MEDDLKQALAKLGMTQQEAIEGQAKAFEAFKKANDERATQQDALHAEKMNKIQAELDKFEPLSKALVKANEDAKDLKEKLEEQREQLDEIQAIVQRPKAGAIEIDAKMLDQRKAFFEMVRMGDSRMQPERRNVLQIGDDTTGGYLSTPDYVAEIIKSVIEFSPMRQMVRVRQTSSKSIQLPRRSGTFAARWAGEVETRTENTGLTYALEDTPVHELVAEVYVSRANLEDSAFDIEAELREEFGEQFGVAEGIAMISGNGVKKPEGLLQAAGTVASVSGTVNGVSADGLIDLSHSIKTAYAVRGSFLMNRSTLAKIRKLKDGTGQYLWMPGLADARPNTIDGSPYVEAPDMPDVATGAKAIAFGDWKRAYTLADRISLMVLRDDLTRATFGQVKFLARRRVGGQVVLAEAIGVQTIS